MAARLLSHSICFKMTRTDCCLLKNESVKFAVPVPPAEINNKVVRSDRAALEYPTKGSDQEKLSVITANMLSGNL